MTELKTEKVNNVTNANISTVADNQLAVYFVMSFRKLCLATVSLPLIALLLCFVTAYIFQYDDVHETHCRVYNVIPSISAITGITPQIYLWRVCVALHIGPRIIIASVYHKYYSVLLQVNNDEYSNKSNNTFWLNVTYWLNVTEIAALCGVTYISNRENYPIHEKIFITFMISSLLHMLTNIKVLRLARSFGAIGGSGQTVIQSLFIKQILFATSLIATFGLIIFFLKHRLLCHDLAFSWFALCEYIIASANMAFHVTVIYDFPTENLIVANDVFTSTSNKKNQ